ncbi:MAG: hypothetical protein AABX27_01935 [Nanoarchaeota archaeon]
MAEELKLWERRRKVKGLLKPSRTVTQVIKELRGLAAVKPMALKDFYKEYGVENLNPLETLADGLSFELPASSGMSEWTYLVHRNAEPVAYIIDIFPRYKLP